MTLVHVGTNDVVDYWRNLYLWSVGLRDRCVDSPRFFVGSGLIKVLAINALP